MKFVFAICIAFFGSWGLSSVWGQSADLPLQHEGYHYLDRLDIQGRIRDDRNQDSICTVSTEVKPYSRTFLSGVFKQTYTSGMQPRTQQWHDLMRLALDDAYADTVSGKGVFKKLYRNQRDFFALNTSGLTLYANPILHLGAGQEIHNYTADLSQENRLLTKGARGVQVRGTLFGKVGFLSEFTENQMKTPQFIRNLHAETGVLAGESFVKVYDAQTPNPGFDYLTARGYFTYSPAKQIRLKIGKDRAFLGNGHQSLFLSDHSADHFFLNINTRVWKIEYVNHFAVMTDYLRGKPDTYGTHPKKYAVVHQLFYRPWHWLSWSLFESVAYSPVLPGGIRGFELEYLNPLIFYRSVEQSLGSPDNSMLGTALKANLLKRFQVYGQIALDDYNFRSRNLGPGYFGNKYALQGGIKYIDAFWIPRLDLQVEFNAVRPYTYAHFNPSGAWTHYGQNLAHSLGANAKDFHLIARYQPFPRIGMYLCYSNMLKGLNNANGNYGGDLSLPYTLYVSAFNNFIGQGTQLKINQVYGRLSYRLLKLDGYVDLEARYRKENQNTGISVMGSFRLNMPNIQPKY
jgi:hypothetical protein